MNNYFLRYFDQVSFRSFSSRKIYEKNPANTDEVRIQVTIFSLKMYNLLQDSKISK